MKCCRLTYHLNTELDGKPRAPFPFSRKPQVKTPAVE